MNSHLRILPYHACTLYFSFSDSRSSLTPVSSTPDHFVGERAKRARHSQVCSIENRIYILYITRKMVPIMGRASS